MAPMIPRLPLTALLVLVLSTLGPLASASPPDPGWIGGFSSGSSMPFLNSLSALPGERDSSGSFLAAK